ncbi:MAG: tRNA (N6-threonylcarbamoyladenosine(37)-N6)-methyltransferase TrmO [Fibrobacterota bacterium]
MLIDVIGTMRTCFPEKFGIPRQSGLAPLARGVLRFEPTQPAAVWRDCLRGLDGFTHVWITFVFHQAVPEGWKALVRPPRLGGKEKMGVFATRSPHRPNFLGQSLLDIERVDFDEPSILFKGVDLLDATPVVDIRPFHPANDSPSGEVRGGWLSRANEATAVVEWSPEAKEQFLSSVGTIPSGMPRYDAQEARELVDSLIGLDPRPGHLRGGSGDWAMRLLGFDVKFRMDGEVATIVSIEDATSRSIGASVADG